MLWSKFVLNSWDVFTAKLVSDELVEDLHMPVLGVIVGSVCWEFRCSCMRRRTLLYWSSVLLWCLSVSVWFKISGNVNKWSFHSGRASRLPTREHILTVTWCKCLNNRTLSSCHIHAIDDRQLAQYNQGKSESVAFWKNSTGLSRELKWTWQLINNPGLQEGYPVSAATHAAHSTPTF